MPKHEISSIADMDQPVSRWEWIALACELRTTVNAIIGLSSGPELEMLEAKWALAEVSKRLENLAARWTLAESNSTHGGREV